MKIAILHGWLAFCAATALTAQDDTGAAHEAREAKGRVAWFVYTNVPEGLENPVNIMSGKDISQVLLSKLSPSDPVKIPADGILRMVRKIENPQDPTKPGYLVLAQAVVPETVTSAIVILMPVAKNPNGLLFQTKVQDLAAFKGGDTMFLNMTNLKIGVELGKDKIQVEPGQFKIHNPLGAAKSVSLPIRLSFFHPERKEWDMITASTVALYSTRREMCIFNWDVNFNRVDYESVTIPVTQ
jgi:hypothetical protein